MDRVEVPYTFEFNDDSTVVAGDTPKLVPAYGNYLNDLSLEWWL